MIVIVMALQIASNSCNYFYRHVLPLETTKINMYCSFMFFSLLSLFIVFYAAQLDGIGWLAQFDTLFANRNTETQAIEGCISFGEVNLMSCIITYSSDHLAKLTWPWVRVSDPGSPRKMDGLNLHFFWRRVTCTYFFKSIRYFNSTYQL